MEKQRTLIGLNSAVFLMMLGVGMMMALLPQRIIALTGSGGTVGYLASAFAISYILLQVPIGRLSDRFGFKPFLFWGYLLCSLTGVLYYFADHPNLYFWGRVFQGAGEAPVWALAPALLSLRYPAAKGRVIGIYNASLHIGLTIGPLLGILLAKELTGRQPFLFYAGVCLGGALLLQFSVPTERGEARGGGQSEKQTFDWNNLAALVTLGNSLAALLGIALYGAGYGLFLTTIPSFLILVKNFQQTSVGLFFALFYIAISLSQVITGGLSDRMGRKVFMIAGLFLAAWSIAIFTELPPPWIVAALTAGSLGLGVFYLSSMAYLNEVVPDTLKGTISGAYYLFWGIGFFVGPLLIGKMNGAAAVAGYRIFAVLLFMEALILVFCNKRSEIGSKRGDRNALL